MIIRRPPRRSDKTREWQARVIDDGFGVRRDPPWDYAEGVNPEDAAQFALREISMDNYEEWEMSGSPKEIIIDVKKSEKAKKITRVICRPSLEIEWNTEKQREGGRRT